nr:aa3-type cytochrome c oxidase subunit IV [Parerythrobacter lutipelagi]
MAGNDIKAAEKTYDSFIGSLKWSVPLIALITAIVVILIAD